MPTGTSKFLLGANIFFIALYTALLIYAGVATDGNKRVGLIAAFGTAQVYAFAFLLFLVLSFCAPMRSSDRNFNCAFCTIFFGCIIFLIGNVAVIIIGSQLHGYVRTGLLVAGSVSLVHYFGFILLIMVLFGVSAAHG